MPLRYGLIDPAEIAVPRLPRALEGLRIAHVTDLHVRGRRRLHHRLISQLTSSRVDLVLFTGDYVDLPGDEQPAMDLMGKLLAGLRPRIGCFGVFGNHDTPEFREQARELPLHWLDGTVYEDEHKPLRISGVSGGTDLLADFVETALDEKTGTVPVSTSVTTTQRPLQLLLCHWPNRIAVASEMDFDLMLAGHSHGGQFRLPTGHVLFNGTSELPLSMTTGLLRCGNTLAATSRGVGNSNLDFRIFCPPHVPLYTLRRGNPPGENDRRIRRVWFW